MVTWIAVSGLLISLTLLVLNIENRLRDAHKLDYESFMTWSSGKNGDYAEIYVHITNRGKRPVSILEVYYEEDETECQHPIRTSLYGGVPPFLDGIELGENQTRHFKSEKLSHEEMIKKTRRLNVGIIDSRKKHYRASLHNEAYDFETSTS